MRKYGKGEKDIRKARGRKGREKVEGGRRGQAAGSRPGELAFPEARAEIASDGVQGRGERVSGGTTSEVRNGRGPGRV